MRTVTDIISICQQKIDEGEIDGSISADGIVTFNDSVPSFSKAQIENLLAAAQEEVLLLADLDRKMGRSREFLSKVCGVGASCLVGVY